MAARAGVATSFEIRGDEELKRQLEQLPKRLTGLLVDALNDVMREELEEMRNRTPTLSGALASSGRLIPARVTPRTVEVGVRFGEGIEPYAVVQHERYWYQHDDGGPRYVTAVLEESKPFLVRRIAQKVFAAWRSRG